MQACSSTASQRQSFTLFRMEYHVANCPKKKRLNRKQNEWNTDRKQMEFKLQWIFGYLASYHTEHAFPRKIPVVLMRASNRTLP